MFSDCTEWFCIVHLKTTPKHKITQNNLFQPFFHFVVVRYEHHKIVYHLCVGMQCAAVWFVPTLRKGRRLAPQSGMEWNGLDGQRPPLTDTGNRC
jgi:hypothetical protein